MQNAQGSFSPAVCYDSYDGPASIQVADVNGDGLKDIIVSHGGAYVGIYSQRPDGSLMPEDRYFGGRWATWYGATAVGDINGDGLPDIVVTGYLSGAGVLYHRPQF